MKTLNTLRAATIATMAVAAVSLPTLAHATDSYRTYDRAADCRAQENEARLIGGILGAVVGGVVGSEVSGNGARTEGSAIGAVVGGLAGAGLGDQSVDCDKNRRTAYRNDGYTNRTTYGTRAPIITVGHNTGYNDRYNGRTNDRYNGRTNDRYNDRDYRNNGQWMKERRRLEKRLKQIDKRQHKVEHELKKLHDSKRYMSRSEFTHYRAELYADLNRLNDQERQIRRQLNYRTAGYTRSRH